GCFPFPRPAEPWPSAGTTVPSRNFTVRPAPIGVAPVTASRANAHEVPTDPSAMHNPLNSRRFSNRISSLFIRPSISTALGRTTAFPATALLRFATDSRFHARRVSLRETLSPNDLIHVRRDWRYDRLDA